MTYEWLEESHADTLSGRFLDDRIYTYLPANPRRSVEDLRSWFRRISVGGPDDGSEGWLNWVLRETETGVYVGWIQATVYPPDTAGIAYVVFPEFQGSGYATEGCRALLGHLATRCGVRRAFAEIDTRNAPSIRLAVRLGFRCASLRRNADFFRGAPSDEYRFEKELSTGA